MCGKARNNERRTIRLVREADNHHLSVRSIPKNLCTGCEACANACQYDAIFMCSDEEGFLYPEIHLNLCIECGLCVKVCPVMTTRSPKDPIYSYAARAEQKSIRAISSSGGVFYYLARCVIKNMGVVYGVTCNANLEIQHIAVDNIDDIRRLTGSKYVQSKIGSTYKTAKVALEDERPVLFSGTPCQIAGLKSYLGKDYKNLLCVDFICHGVPSPLVYRLYISYLEQEYGAKAINVEFRSKKQGWKDFSLVVKFENGDSYSSSLSENMYLQGFIHDLFNRPSCHKCMFKAFRSHSDITLGDFWRVDKVITNIDDNYGVSAVMIITERGYKIYKSIEKYFKSIPTGYESISTNNTALLISTKPHKNRSSFFGNLKDTDIVGQIAKALMPSIQQRIKKKFRAFIKRAKDSFIV